MVCKTLVIVHGASEMIFCKNIAKNLRIDIEFDSNDNGASCIQIRDLKERLSAGAYRNEQSLHKAFDKLEYNPRKADKLPIRIFTIMDTDDSPLEKKSYISGDLFRNTPFCNKITPIYNINNLDDVFDRCGYTIDRCNKVRAYQDLMKNNDLSDIHSRLTEDGNTNLDVFVDYCFSISPRHR